MTRARQLETVRQNLATARALGINADALAVVRAILERQVEQAPSPACLPRGEARPIRPHRAIA